MLGSRYTRLTLVAAALLLSACGGDDPTVVSATGSTSRTLSVTPGSLIVITLQAIGPGEYASPPTVSSSSVRFIDMTYVSPAVPAGPTQRFRFRAVSSGRAVVVLQHTYQNATVEDTIDVR